MLQRRRFYFFSSTILVQSCQCLSRFIDYKLYHQCVSKSGVVDVNGGERGSKNRDRGECEFRLYKSRGQHLLTSTRVLDAIVKKSDIKPTDTVLEIGPGTGNLTLRLLEAAENVVAVEIDLRMAEALVKRVADCGLEDRLTLIREDALKTEYPKFDLVVANIPYNISSPLIAKLLFGTWSFRSATLLLQKEFARRLVAKPGDSEFNRLAVNVNLVADVEHIMDVSKRDFFPVPKVDSSVVVIRPKVDIPNVDLSEWCAFTRTCFCKKNKTLGATFKQKRQLIELMRISALMGSKDNTSTFQDVKDDDGIVNDADPSRPFYSAMGKTLFKEKVVGILKSSGFEDKRPSKLSVEGLLHLLSLFNQNKIFFHDKGGKRSNDVELAASFQL
ncbi:ribosomal RNA small subunit methyltransferase, mitochondrial-like [Silene latifolia]|uniref:ribosomal RNA small subunit methyltransferase, mitochondrial-like n=1 Tax=Silene latifolia TaxID=37657 RepID=UPI003D76EE91